MRKIIHKYGIIIREYERPKNISYRKGSYFVVYDSELLDFSCVVGHIDKYRAYKSIVNDIEMILKEQGEENKKR